MTQAPVRTEEATLSLVIARRDEIAEGVVSIQLARPDGGPLPSWEPGAHVDLVLGDKLVRQYSLTGVDDDPSRWEIAFLVEPDGRGGSRRLSEMAVPGTVLTVRGPRNHFRLESRDHYRFIAGGIGITPIRAMIGQAEDRGVDWKLLYGGRTAASMAFADELVSRYGERVQVVPQDVMGLLDLRGFLESSPRGSLTYCCGPEPLLVALNNLGHEVGDLDVRVERFSPRGDIIEAEDTEFEVELVQTGVTVTVPVGRSILSVAEEAGAFVTSSCEEGTCGSCETRVISGIPDHRDSVLDPDEAGDSMMICVSRCTSDRLVLDL